MRCGRVPHGSVRFDTAGTARSGSARICCVWKGLAGKAAHGSVRPGEVRQDRNGTDRDRLARYGQVRSGRSGLAAYGLDG